MKTLLFGLILFSAQTFGACKYGVSKEDSKISWTAFKTPRKVGVTGEFKKFELKFKKTDSMKKLLKKASFEIDTQSVFTNNPDRDKKIVKNFFTTDKKPLKIEGKITSFTNESSTMKLTIGEKSKEVILKNSYKDGLWKMEGEINVLDFKLDSNLSNINLACKALHEGVTWPDVKIAVEFKEIKTCK